MCDFEETLKVVTADSQLIRLYSLTSDVTTEKLSHYKFETWAMHGTSHNILSLLQENLATTKTTLTCLVENASIAYAVSFWNKDHLLLHSLEHQIIMWPSLN